MSMNVNGSTQQTGGEWFRNMKLQKPDRNAPESQPPQADRKGTHKHKMALSAGKAVFIIVVRKIPVSRQRSPVPMTISLASSSLTEEKRAAASISCIR